MTDPTNIALADKLERERRPIEHLIAGQPRFILYALPLLPAEECKRIQDALRGGGETTKREG